MKTKNREFVDEIYKQWALLRKKCGENEPRLTQKRIKQIVSAIEKFGKDRIILVIRYMSESEDSYAKFMRGSSGTSYISLDNIFRDSKFNDKYKKALHWNSKKPREIEDVFIPYFIVEAEDDRI
jgi:hypothetical protein